MRKRNFNFLKGNRLSIKRKAEILSMPLEERLEYFSQKKDFQLPGLDLPTADQVLSGSVRHKRINHADPIHLSALISDIGNLISERKRNNTPDILMNQFFSEFEYFISKIKNETLKMYATELLKTLK